MIVQGYHKEVIDELYDENKRLQSRVAKLERSVKFLMNLAITGNYDWKGELLVIQGDKIDPWHCRMCGKRTSIGNGYCAMHGALAAVEEIEL